MKTRVNLKLLGGLLVALLVLGAGIHFLHGYQVGRTAGELRARALEEEKSRNFSQSAEYLSLYLGYVPGDINARAQYGLIRAELASRARNPRAQTQAMVYLEGVLRSAPDRDDIRKRIAELAIELGRFPDAREHLNTLLKQSPDNAGWHYLYGQCEEAAKEYPQAADCYEKTIQHDPARVDSYARLADIQDRKLNKQSIAEKTLQSMVTANPLSSEAFVQRARFYQRLSRWDAAARDLDVARRLAPDDARVLLAAAEVAYAKREIEPARGCLKRGLELHPDDVRFYQQLARLELNVGRKKEARDVLHRILALRPSGTQSWYVASMLLDMNELAEARQLLRRLQKESSSDPQVRYLQARMLACESRWQEASQMLEDLVPLLATADYSANDLAMCSELLLAECYSQLGIPDQAVRAYQRAVKLDQESLPARVGLASAFVSASQIDDAIEEYRKLLPKMPQARMVLARLLILHNLSLPSGSRRWTEVDEVLAAARRAGESADEVKVLTAEFMAARGKVEDCEKLLEAECKKQPNNVGFRIALSNLALSRGDNARGLQTLRAAQRELGDSSEIRIAMIRVLSSLGPADAEKSLALLEQGLDQFTDAERVALLRALADAHFQLNNIKEPFRLTKELIKLQPQNLNIRLLLLELALQLGEEAAIDDALAGIERTEGPGGILWSFGRASQLLWLATKETGDKSGLPEARARVADVLKKRPRWSRASLLQAQLEEQDGKPESAISAYLQAIEQGDRRSPVVRRVVELLTERHRYLEADRMIRKLMERNQRPISGELGRMAAELARMNDDYSRAAELAQNAVSVDSKGCRDHVWLGQILGAVGRLEQAEKTLQRAVALFSTESATWVALVQFQARTNKLDKAEATIKSAAEKIPAKDAPIVLGQCYEAIGRADEAERQYQKALLTNPVTIATIRHVAEFYLRNGRLERAGDYLRRIADPNNHASPADLAWARRNLAVELAAGGIPQIREGLALIEQNLKSERSSADDQVAKAVILSALPSSRSEAIALFESTFRIKPPSDRDLLMLARAYEANGEWTKARDSMLRLVAAEPVQPLLLDQFVRMLLKRSENSEPGARQGALDEAQVWLGRLEKKDPNSFRTLELRTRLLGAQGRGTEAASLLEKHAQRKKDDVFRVASQLDQLGQARLAEEMYRQCLRETKSAEPTLALADFLGRQGRGPEAIDLCQKALRAGTPAGTVATVAVNAVRQSPRVPEIVKPVERLIENNLNKDPQPIVLLIALAQLRDIQGRYPDSAELYRKVLALDPENVVALNNLAWFLALERTTANEALDLVNRAVKVAGPTGEFLDTKAVAELRLGLTSQAIEDLEGALRQAPTPARYLHLAQAHRDAKNLSDATLAWQTAKKLLKGSSVHPLEKRSYQELAEALGS